MGYIKSVIEEIFPSIHVHLIQIGDTEEEDRNRGFFDLVERQVEQVCEQVANNANLTASPYINAIGFSQGGQFLRSFVERCNFPKVRNLITFGSQHMGVADAPGCTPENSGDGSCAIMRNLIRSGSYWPWVQRRSVQAQYFRDPKNIPKYLQSSLFLAAANNEIPEKRNETFKENLASLNKLVLIRFTEEETVVPAESSWFGYFDENLQVVPMREQEIYKEDWIGIKALDDAGKLVFLESEGKHMKFSIEYFQEIVKKYLGNEGVINDAKEDNGDMAPSPPLVFQQHLP
ncbi:Palmitoyl-protein thioesterase 1 [Phlyctochytrium planicorne]|nr:Palmitoyl-protein thioesterase 1 [Phlyctochytrium planicorne]